MRVAFEGDFIREVRQSMASTGRRMAEAVEALSVDDVRWRPNPESNSVANLVLHVCGNLRQRFHSGFGSAADDRRRDAEFAAASSDASTPEGLAALVRSMFAEIDAFLAGLPPERLGEERAIQGESASLLTMLMSVATHSALHYGQVVYVAKLRKGAGFGTQSIPRTP